MTIKKFKQILDVLEQHGFGDEDLQADHDIIYILELDKFDILPQDVKEVLCGKGKWGEEGYEEGVGCFRSPEHDSLCCFV